MKIALIGATGSVGSRLLDEALSRGHVVTAVSRHPERMASRKGVTAIAADINDATGLASVLRGHDAVVSSVRFVNFEVATLLRALKAADIDRLVMVGGAGSLTTASGGALADAPTFPSAVLPEARAGAATLAALRQEAQVNWTFISPSAVFAPGERTGKFRLGGDTLLLDHAGKSHVSQEDYAIALLDELETNAHPRQRITVGY